MRPFGQCLELRPNDTRMHFSVIGRLRGEAAIDTRSDVLPSDPMRITQQALGDELRVLNDVACMRDHAGAEHLVFGQAQPFE